METTRRTAVLALGLSFAVLPACSNLGGLEDILGGAMGGEVRAEVQSVDDRRREIDVITEDRRSLRVLWDERTRVVYQGRDYPVTALERGDLVRMDVTRTRDGEPYTDYIYVERSVGDPTGDYGTAQRLEGEVGWVDRAEHEFILDSREAGQVMVMLPRDATREMIRDFDALDRGDWIRVEVRPVTRERAELVRFGW